MKTSTPVALRSDAPPLPLTTSGAAFTRTTRRAVLSVAGILGALALTTRSPAPSPAYADATADQAAAIALKVDKGELVFNVKDHGAIGNGVADDTAAFVAANAAAAVSVSSGLGGTIYVPQGTFNTHFVLSDYVQLRGAGQRASRLQGVGAVTVVTTGSHCVLSDLHVRGDATAGSVGVKPATSAARWSMRHCFVSGHETGIWLEETWIVALDRVVLQSNTTGVRLNGANVNAVNITGGEIQGATDGFYGTTSASTKINLTGVTFENCTNYAIYNTGPIYGLTIRDCYFEANTSGNIYNTGTARSLNVVGCTFSGVGAFGVKLAAGLDVLLEGNTFNTSTGGAKSIHVTAGTRVTIGRNWYASGHEFVTSDFAGTELLWMDREYQLPPSTTAGASIRLPHGTAPTSPTNGDLWTTTAGLYARINSGTVGPYGAATPPQIDAFTASGTYTKPAGAKLVRVVLIGGGSGGASGRRGLAGTIRCGGGGGGGGSYTALTLDAADVASNVAVTIGAGGTAGATQTVDNNNGNPGVAGGASLFAAHAQAGGGSASVGGTALFGTGGSGGVAMVAGATGGSASTKGLVGGAANSAGGAGGGGSGGGISAANAAANGGAGTTSRMINQSAGGSAGVVDRTRPTSPTPPVDKGLPGAGGGGGAASITKTAQTGASAVGYGGGGGGGGAARNGNKSGAGGNGASGYCLVITTF